MKKHKTLSSTRWLSRNANDRYITLAKQEGYKSRAAFKLIEINQKFKLLTKPQKIILDIGAAPGGWVQVLTKFGHYSDYIICVDKLNIDDAIIKSNDKIVFINGDIYSQYTVDMIEMKLKEIQLQLAFKNNKFNDQVNDNDKVINGKIINVNTIDVKYRNIGLVLSDIAPSSCGDKVIDHIRIIDLVTRVFHITESYIEKGGAFVCKTFTGNLHKTFVEMLKKRFKSVKLFKPQSSYSDSSEIFVIAQKYIN